MNQFFDELPAQSDIEQEETCRLIKHLVSLPDEQCVICGKTIEEVGGQRIASQPRRGIWFSPTYKGGGNPAAPHKSIKLNEAPLYLVVCGEKEMWTDLAIERAVSSYRRGRRAWFCQVCGHRTCSTCGAPINLPMGSEILHTNGSITYCNIIPFNPGCINPACKNYKDFGNHDENR